MASAGRPAKPQLCCSLQEELAAVCLAQSPRIHIHGQGSGADRRFAKPRSLTVPGRQGGHWHTALPRALLARVKQGAPAHPGTGGRPLGGLPQCSLWHHPLRETPLLPLACRARGTVWCCRVALP